MAPPDQSSGGETSRLQSVLADPRRRHAIRILSDARSPLALADLAAEIASRESDGEEATWERIARVSIALYHNHVPRMTDVGVVEYNEARRTVSLADPDGERSIESGRLRTYSAD